MRDSLKIEGLCKNLKTYQMTYLKKCMFSKNELMFSAIKWKEDHPKMSLKKKAK